MFVGSAMILVHRAPLCRAPRVSRAMAARAVAPAAAASLELKHTLDLLTHKHTVHTHLLTYLPTHLLTYFLSYLLITYLLIPILTYLLTYFLTYLLTYRHSRTYFT